MKTLEDYVTTIPNFPKEGIMFRDITTIIDDKDGFRLAVDMLLEKLKGVDFDVIAAAESRGFIFAAPLAYELGKGLILIRKKGKLPRETYSLEYELEYGTAALEIHKDDIKPGQKVLLIDDLIATGGTTEAMIKLVEMTGGKVVSIGFIMELAGLKGMEKLKQYNAFSLITYPGI